ncbi:MAG TPA: M20/M25/M40 family metallo-hydrolase, partial [Nannocystis sp.]
MSPRRYRLAVLGASLLVAALACLRSGPPAPLPADAPADRFSAARAHAVLADLLGDGAPHPVGSAANARFRARLLEHLRALGLQPEEQRAFTCTERGSCAEVTNILAWLPGQVPGPALALVAHYDSVPAGPGAADDGHGVAVVLEVLRALRDSPRHAPLVAIFTDGEEAGLLGARALGRHPRLGELGIALNVEARGTTGAGRMFETSDGNAALIAAYAAAPRPSAHSLSYEVYRRLPNDTDFTILKRHGLQGMNFAFIGGVQRYHTPRDDLAHLDLGSVQQHGDAVLAAARALLAADLPAPSAHNAHYADLLGLVLLRWPAWLDLPLAGLVVLALLASALRRRRELSVRRVLLALAAPVLAVAAALAGAGLLLWAIAALTGPLGPWPAASGRCLLALAAAASAAALAALRPLARR